MAKSKKVDLEKIPEVLEKITALASRDIDNLLTKDELSDEESKRVIAYATMLSNLHKDYRAQIVAIEKDLKTKSREDILALIKAEAS